MTADELIRALELERAQPISPSPLGLGLSDSPEVCAARLAEAERASYGVATPKMVRARRRAYERAREAAGR